MDSTQPPAAVAGDFAAVVVVAVVVGLVAAAVAGEVVAVASSMACSAAAIASMTAWVRVKRYNRALDCKQGKQHLSLEDIEQPETDALQIYHTCTA